MHQRRLDIWTHFFTKQAFKDWDRLPREAVDVPGLSVFKRHLENAIKNII